MYKVQSNLKDQQYASFTIARPLWKTPCKIHFFFDEEKFAFSLQSMDYSNGGFIDFGVAKRKRNELVNQIEMLCMEETQAANIAFVK